jgi:hypothetical protein
MDDPSENANAVSPLPELIIGTVGVGLLFAASIAPVTIAAGLYLLGGLTCGVAFLAAVDCERARNACEPCRWAEKEQEDSQAITLSAITMIQQPTQDATRWGDVIREAKAADKNRSR